MRAGGSDPAFCEQIPRLSRTDGGGVGDESVGLVGGARFAPVGIPVPPEFRAALRKTVADVLKEDQVEDDVLPLGRVHVAAHPG